MRNRLWLIAAALFFCTFARVADAEARTLTWARSEDVQTLDPHALNESVALALDQQIYEPLLQRDSHGKALPALAESWTLTTNPLVWEFRLRPNVVFHDGSPFTAEDVIFSLSRAQQPGSGFHNLLSPIESVEEVEPLVIRIKTRGPTPLLPAFLTHLLIMSKSWTEKMHAAAVPDRAKLHLSPIARAANGTGPFELVSRQPGVRTVMKRFGSYWQRGQTETDITELIYRPIRNDTERIRMLTEGEVDFVQDVPVNEIARLQADKKINVNVGPENRSVFLGLDFGSQIVNASTGSQTAPFSDLRVRQAVNMAINRQAIQKNVTLGQSIPTGIIAPPSINGYTRQLDQIPPHDIAKAKRLMAEAGFADGFAITLDCPIDNRLRAGAICAEIGSQLKAIGIKVETRMHSRSAHNALIRETPELTDFFLIGRSVPTFDSEELFVSLYHTRNDRGGSYNATGYSNPDVDRLTESLAVQTDFIARNQTIARIWQIVQGDIVYVPLHIQTLAYATKAGINIPVDIENLPKLKAVRQADPQ
ncbi:MAG: ABC transporter substrate-binding protein [Hyphomicrobiaceae bacterium]